MEVRRWSSDAVWPENIGLIIGNFDGVHRGHQEMLTMLLNACTQRGLLPVAMSFYPHPRSVILKQEPGVVSPIRDRAFWLSYYGLKSWILMPFTASFMRLAPEGFVRDYLSQALHVRYLLVGDDFRFGYRGAGNYELLENMASASGYELARIETVSSKDAQRISSSRIRDCLFAHHIERARELLGHDLTLTSRVRSGAGRGRKLDARTANIHVPEKWCLPDGVYVVQLRVCAQHSQWMWGVANLGTNPTFNGTRRKLEVHVMTDACPNLYGEQVQVSMRQFLRGEIRFANAEALKQQIQHDITAARDFIAVAEK